MMGVSFNYYELQTEDEVVEFTKKTGMLGLPVLVIEGTPLLAKDMRRIKHILSCS